MAPARRNEVQAGLCVKHFKEFMTNFELQLTSLEKEASRVGDFQFLISNF